MDSSTSRTRKAARDLQPGDGVDIAGGRWVVASVEPITGSRGPHILGWDGSNTSEVLVVRSHPVGQPGSVYPQPIAADHVVNVFDPAPFTDAT